MRPRTALFAQLEVDEFGPAPIEQAHVPVGCQSRA
jgi:hypothetical protein